MTENDTPEKPTRLAAAVSKARGDVNSDNIEAGIHFLNQQSEHIRKQGPEDVQRIGENLDALLNEPMPTTEEADAYLRGLGIIKKCEVCGQDATLTNQFVSHLIERHQTVYAELQKLRADLAAPDAAQGRDSWLTALEIADDVLDEYEKRYELSPLCRQHLKGLMAHPIMNAINASATKLNTVHGATLEVTHGRTVEALRKLPNYISTNQALSAIADVFAAALRAEGEKGEKDA